MGRTWIRLLATSREIGSAVTELPRISVIVPCYNAAPYVTTALASVYAQQWDNLEVIVVDDGSKDDSVARVERAFPGTRILRQANAGVADARNAGLRVATGAWVAFLDADDYWLPGKLHAQWAMLKAHGAARMAYSAWVVWESSDPEPGPGFLAEIATNSGNAALWTGPSGWIYPELLLDCEVWTSTVLADRALFEEIGAFQPGMRIGEDYDLWLRASRVTEILRLSRPTALYRIHVSNTTRKPPARNFQAEVVEQAITRWGLASPDGRLARASQVKRALARTWRNFAGAHLESGNRSSARSGALRAIRLDPGHAGAWKILARTLVPR